MTSDGAGGPVFHAMFESAAWSRPLQGLLVSGWVPGYILHKGLCFRFSHLSDRRNRDELSFELNTYRDIVQARYFQ